MNGRKGNIIFYINRVWRRMKTYEIQVKITNKTNNILALLYTSRQTGFKSQLKKQNNYSFNISENISCVNIQYLLSLKWNKNIEIILIKLLHHIIKSSIVWIQNKIYTSLYLYLTNNVPLVLSISVKLFFHRFKFSFKTYFS